MLCDIINLTPTRKSDPVVSNPKEEQRAVPVPKTFDQGTKTATVTANQSSEFQDSSQRTSMAESATVVANLMKEAMSKPTLELFKFDGNPTAYSRFISVFESTLEATENDDRRKLLYLIQHCTGKAKSLIDYCLLLKPTQGLAKAKQILYENYGKKNMITRSYINALLDGPSIKPDDPTALINLAQKLEECSTTLEHLHYFSDLNCFKNLVKIIRRLPSALQTRWLRSAAKIKEEGREPRFSDVRKFVAKEAVVVKSSYAPAINKNKKPAHVPKYSAHSTVIERSKSRPAVPRSLICWSCSANHYVWDCPNFKRKSVSERLQFMRQARLCDNCAKRGHVSRYCLAKPGCNVSGCTRRHHFLLHTEFGDSRPTSSSAATRGSSDSTPQQSQVSTSNFSGATVIKSANNMCLNVVPVKISSGSKTVLIYAFLDEGSTATLCDERLLDLLQITGKPAKFAISTVNERADIHRGSKVTLTVNSLAGGEPLNLQNVLSVKRLLALRNQPLTKDELQA